MDRQTDRYRDIPITAFSRPDVRQKSMYIW